MWNGFTIILILLLFFLHPQKDLNYNKQGRPSTYGINTYIKNNEESLIREYVYRVDTLFDVNIFTDDLDETSDGDLGQFYIPDYVVVSNREKYAAYEFKDLSKFKQRTISYTERTVKAVVFHELTHTYFYRTSIMMRNRGQHISSEYSTLRMFPISKFNTDFIEEGICEYVIYHLNESNPIEDIPIPDNLTDLLDENNRVNNIYGYSVIFLKDFLDKYGVKEGVEILIGNNPPTYEEILNPELFYKRLKYF
jgi:hypothetical protein